MKKGRPAGRPYLNIILSISEPVEVFSLGRAALLRGLGKNHPLGFSVGSTISNVRSGFSRYLLNGIYISVTFGSVTRPLT